MTATAFLRLFFFVSYWMWVRRYERKNVYEPKANNSVLEVILVLTWIEKYEKKEHQFGTFYFWNIHISIQQIDSTDFVFQFSYLITFPLLWALGIRCAISTVKCLWASHKSCFFSLLQSTQMRDSRSNTHTLPQSISIIFLQFLYFLLIYKGIVSQIHWTINT